MRLHLSTPAADGEAAIRTAGAAVNHQNPSTEDEIHAALPLARAAALAVKSRSESTGPLVGQFTGLNISPFQNWLYERNREWRFTDGTLCVLWCLEFPEARSDYAKHHTYIHSTRRSYNAGRHYSTAPIVPSVAYDRFGSPITEHRSTRRVGLEIPRPAGPPENKPSTAPRTVEPSVSRESSSVPDRGLRSRAEAGGARLITDPVATTKRLAALESYMNAEVLGSDGFVCRNYGACKQSHAGYFFEGQLHHVGRHYDLTVGGRPFRIVVVGQEYGNGPPRVTLDDRYQDVAVRTGLQKRFRTDGIHAARNPHMRGTTSLLRLLLGRETGDRHEDEFWDVDGHRIHLFDMFALVNFLLCSAISDGESDSGSKPGRSTPIMQRNCGRHFIQAIEILEPNLVVVQGRGVFQWITRAMREEAVEDDTLRRVRIGAHRTLLAELSHPAAYGDYNWADPSRSYLRGVVVPTVLRARRILLEDSPE